MRKALGTLIFLSLILSSTSFGALTRPKLIVVLVIDQFRSDYVTRFEKRFLPARTKNGDVGGFEYLKSMGAYYPFAQYDILQSMTGPGHSTILTGSYPYLSGIPINGWYDSVKGEKVYCVEDKASPLVGASSKDAGPGMSPAHLNGTTFGDELKNAGFHSRVVTIALKDRAAILLGGRRADLALWFDASDKQWISSRFYLPEGKLPNWVNKLNQDLKQHEGDQISWELSGPGSGFSEPAKPPLTRTSEYASKVALAFPHGMELTEAAAERALDAYGLGRGKSTDLLAISFSSHDYSGHEHGPNSREQEEMTVAEDLLISQLLNAIKDKIPGGLKEVAVVLTGDHGIPMTPEYAQAHRIDGGYLPDQDVAKTINEALTAKFGKSSDGDWVVFGHEYNYYLNRKTISKKGLELAKAAQEAKAAISSLNGVAYVFTSADYENRKLPPGMHERQILHTYYPGRSGDVMIIPKPFYMIKDGPVTHMTGYSYDRSVPLMLFYPPHVRAGTFAQRAEVIDIAPTLSFLSGVIPPALSEGRVLSEALKLGTPGAP